jgi:thioredoxin reductase (NADPH)
MMKTLVIGQLFGGLLTTTHFVENWPGDEKVKGADLMKRIESHARSLGAELVGDSVKSVIKLKNGFSVKAEKTYNTKSIIIATGTVHRRLGVPGEGKYYGKGVSYCAACDAPFFKDRLVGVVGGSDSACKEALLLSEYAKKVYIIYRKDKLRAEPIIVDRVKNSKNIEVIYNANVKKINGDKILKSVSLDTGKELALNGLFVEVGHVPQTELARSLGAKLNDKGEIILTETQRLMLRVCSRPATALTCLTSRRLPVRVWA